VWQDEPFINGNEGVNVMTNGGDVNNFSGGVVGVFDLHKIACTDAAIEVAERAREKVGSITFASTNH
jgi:hypothetical protein